MHGIATLQKHARQEGHKEGIEKGRREGLRASARNMLRKGMPMALVAEVTGLSPDEVAAPRDCVNSQQ
ncbi:MAG TPA: hypothetical protein PL162_01930 [Synergistaceae bacterium]|nr:hypothetical protein [Synergistaceae bacterium]